MVKKISKLTAADIMVSPAVCVNKHDRLEQVGDSFIRAGLGGAPVMDNGKMVGIITRSDFVRAPVLFKALDEYINESMSGEQVAPFRDRMASLTVGDVMPTQVLTCNPGTPVREIAAKMTRNHVHRVVVVEDDAPVGTIESLDLVKLMTDLIDP